MSTTPEEINVLGTDKRTKPKTHPTTHIFCFVWIIIRTSNRANDSSGHHTQRVMNSLGFIKPTKDQTTAHNNNNDNDAIGGGGGGRKKENDAIHVETNRLQ